MEVSVLRCPLGLDGGSVLLDHIRSLDFSQVDQILGFLQKDGNTDTVYNNVDYFLMVVKHFLHTSTFSKTVLRQHTALADCFTQWSQTRN